jgi:hypothetical protein
MSPELASPGLESVMDEEGLKEVVTPRFEPKSEELPAGFFTSRRASEDRQRRTYCGLSGVRFFLILAAVIVVLGIALGVGLGVGLSSKKS